MFKIDIKKILIIFSAFLAAELLSGLSLAFPLANQIIFAILLSGVLVLAVYKLEYGLLIVLAELFIGSLGHLFYLNIGANQLPIRIALWSVVMLIFILKFFLQLAKQGNRSIYWWHLKNFSAKKTFGLLFLFVAIGLINGLVRGHALATVFLDFNAWLYFLLLLPIIAVYGGRDEAADTRLKTLFFAAALWISVKTLFLLFVFTHNLSVSSYFYSWLRKTLVGEMTPTLSGWPRIFIQGQIFPAIAFFLVFWNQARFRFKEFFQRRNILALLAAVLFLSSVLISFSRSFWAGLAGTIFFSLVFVWHRFSFKRTVSAVARIGIAGALSFLIIYLVVVFPYPRSGKFNADFLDRVKNSQEAALASRWSLLPVLAKEIKREPFLGQGFGATVTYFSRDPRILANNPSGEYTTYAFEWGYLDLWLKLGLLGLLAYLFLLFKLIITAWRKGVQTNDYLFFGLGAGILFLAATNIFTPYLNHPLGIGFLILSSCLIWPNRVY